MSLTGILLFMLFYCILPPGCRNPTCISQSETLSLRVHYVYSYLSSKYHSSYSSRFLLSGKYIFFSSFNIAFTAISRVTHTFSSSLLHFKGRYRVLSTLSLCFVMAIPYWFINSSQLEAYKMVCL